jgi:uncharacterized Zn-binding protein involved in type VI secretion
VVHFAPNPSLQNNDWSHEKTTSDGEHYIPPQSQNGALTETWHLIYEGDITTTGAFVLNGGSSNTTENGKPIALMGWPVSKCPICGKMGIIAQGYGKYTINDVPVALENFIVKCGCPIGVNLLVSNPQASVVEIPKDYVFLGGLPHVDKSGLPVAIGIVAALSMVGATSVVADAGIAGTSAALDLADKNPGGAAADLLTGGIGAAGEVSKLKATQISGKAITEAITGASTAGTGHDIAKDTRTKKLSPLDENPDNITGTFTSPQEEEDLLNS